MVMKVTESDEGHREELMALRLPIRLTQNELSDLASKIEKLQSSEARHNLPDHFSDKQSIAFANARIFLRIYGRRDSSFPLGNFADPGWQLLVDLFVHQASGKQINVSSACIGSRAPSTTALRYIAEYIEKGILVRTPCEHDQRVSWLSLSENAQAALIELFCDDFM